MRDLLLTAAQMRALERAAIVSGAVTGLELMERAGAGAVEAILAEWPELAEGARRAVVLCGPGNNGGDGFVVARLLRKRGWEVECFLYGDAERLPPDSRVNYERFAAHSDVWSIGFPTLDEEGFGEFVARVWWSSGQDAPYFDILIDAVFGIGLTRPLDLGFRDNVIRSLVVDGDLFPEMPDRPRMVALDIPSGFDSDSGRLYNGAFEAHLCVAFHCAKVGHYMGLMPSAIRKLVVVDIGLDPTPQMAPTFATLASAPSRTTGSVPPQFYNWPGKDKTIHFRLGEKGQLGPDFHKYDHGHALVLAGGVGRGGAARLAARAALRIGAGLVTVAPPAAALIENACRLDAIMLRALRDADGLSEMLGDNRISALCLGPGLGLGDREAALVGAALDAPRPTVLDADALTLLARDQALRTKLHESCVLTPHSGEFARLAPDLADKLNAPAEIGPAYSKLDAAREIAARLGCTVLLKGPDTVIADPFGHAAIHSAAYGREAPWLATAGAGDVLAGMIAGLLARGFQPMAACEAAAWIHVEAARAFGPGLIAEDLPEMVPRVLRGLEEG